jgi:DNA (cytosine-5)-methyltransferase 1
MKVLDLFSGIGGFSLGLERAGMTTVAFCEINPFCRKVLAKHWPDVPIYEDVTKLRGQDVGPVDVISGGYPCQPFSLAGDRKGDEDDRHLWPEMRRLVDECRPAWVIGENVFGHISMGLDEVLSDLETLGYTARTFVIPACAVDAPHRRDRVWIVAHNDGQRRRDQQIGQPECSSKADTYNNGTQRPLANAEDNGIRRRVKQSKSREKARHVANSKGVYAQGQYRRQREGQFGGGRRWEPEPSVGRVAHGVPRRVDRLRALGNAVVPQIPEIIGKAIMEIEST